MTDFKEVLNINSENKVESLNLKKLVVKDKFVPRHKTPNIEKKGLNYAHSLIHKTEGESTMDVSAKERAISDFSRSSVKPLTKNKSK